MIRTLLLALLLALWLPACAAQPLLGEVSISAPTLRPTGAGETVAISYVVGRSARVSVALVGGDGVRYVLRSQEPRSASRDAYSLRFDGTALTDDPVLLRRLLPPGPYRVLVEAQGDDGAQASQELALTLEGGQQPLPEVADLVVTPATISPNADGVDDVAEITYRLPITATVDIQVSTPAGDSFSLVADEQQEPILQRHVWNGRTPDGRLLPDGQYTYTIRARDQYGSLVQRQLPITIAGAGQPEATITYSYMAPQAIMLGDTFTVTMRVKNTGDVPIRTYGPPSGYAYSTQQVFSSVEGARYGAKSGGFWRIGVDWDANSGGAAKRYPYRWAISPRPPEQWRIPFEEDWLMPGEEAVVTGQITVEQQETKMGFYVGLIQDGVGFFQDRTGRTIIRIGF